MQRLIARTLIVGKDPGAPKVGGYLPVNGVGMMRVPAGACSPSTEGRFPR